MKRVKYSGWAPLGLPAGARRIDRAGHDTRLAGVYQNANPAPMTATLSQSQSDLPRWVELASQGEVVLITVEGKPKARLTRSSRVSPWLARMRRKQGRPVRTHPRKTGQHRREEHRREGDPLRRGVTTPAITGRRVNIGSLRFTRTPRFCCSKARRPKRPSWWPPTPVTTWA